MAPHTHIEHAPNSRELLTPQLAGFISIKEQVLRLLRLRLGNLHRQGDRNEPGFDRSHQTLLAAFKKRYDHVDPRCTHADLFADGSIIISARSQGSDLTHDVDRTRGAAGDVLDQAHHEAFVLTGFDHHCRNLGLAEHLESFQPPLAADEVISRARCSFTAAHRDRPFQADGFDVVHDLPMLTLVTRAWVQDRNPGDRNHFNSVGTNGTH